MTELRHLQLVILGIMKDIDELCRKNNIEYYLFGGSALGAIRHKGFIPWDDDMDIIIPHRHYAKFIKACREQLDPEKYYIQETLVDWSMLFSKIRLKGTYFEEPGVTDTIREHRGIFLDVFRLDNAPNGKLQRIWQYCCGKYLLCYCLFQRGYKGASLKKKLLMFSGIPLKWKCLRDFFVWQLVKYNSEETGMYGSFGARFRFKNSFYKKDFFSTSVYVPFEDIQLPVPEKYDEYLTQIYGDYMTPPPVSEQIGWHLLGIDFGQY